MAEFEVPDKSGYSKAQMGNADYRRLRRQKENILELESKKGYELRKGIEKLSYQGAADYSMKKAIIYRNNYIREMEKYAGLDNYDKLLDFFKKHQNPLDFYEAVKATEYTVDLTYQSDENYNQVGFNLFLYDLGILTDDFVFDFIGEDEAI